MGRSRHQAPRGKENSRSKDRGCEKRKVRDVEIGPTDGLTCKCSYLCIFFLLSSPPTNLDLFMRQLQEEKKEYTQSPKHNFFAIIATSTVTDFVFLVHV